MNALQQTKAIQADIKKALDELKAKYGLESADFGNIRYNENGFSTSMNVVFAGGESKEMAKLRLHANLYGLKQDICNAEVLYSNARYKLIGMRNTKVMLEKDGKHYNAPIDAVVASIKKWHPDLCL